MFRYRYGKRVWITLLLLLLFSCGMNTVPDSAPQATQLETLAEDDSNLIKINSTVTYQAGSMLIIATVYDNPQTVSKVDMICQSVVTQQNNYYGSVAVNCQRMN